MAGEPIFTDVAGESWHVRIHGRELQAVGRALHIDAMDLVTGRLPARLVLDDRECREAVLWIACRSQAQARGIDRDAFLVVARGVEGDATEALRVALANVVPGHVQAMLRQVT